MAYVPGYKHDIFISYPREAEFAWVRRFYEDLELKLSQLLKGTIIYFDRNAYKANHHRERMVAAAGESALLVPILLPAYVFEDKFTLKELAAFCKNCVDKDRIVIIEMYPVNEDRPPELHGPNRNRFYDEKTRVLLRPGTVRYDTAMMRIAEDIRDRLKELVDKYRKAVLLAKTTANLDSYSRAIREDLIASGFTVLPEMKYPDDPTDFHEKFKADLAKTDLLVQLLGEPDDDERASAQFQFEEASNVVGIPVLQWANPTVDLSRLSDSWYKRRLEGIDVKPLKKFQIEIKEKLKQLSEPEQEVQHIINRRSLYIASVNQEDKKYAKEIRDIAINLGYKDYDLLDEATGLGQITHAIETAYAVLLLQGKAQTPFIKEWLRIYIRLRENCKTHPKLEALVYAPPSTPEKNDPPEVCFDGLVEIRPPEPFPQEELQEKLRRQPA